MDWREACLARFSRPGMTVNEVFQDLAATVKEQGFEYCSYVLSNPLPTTKPATWWASTYPEEWLQHYFAHDYLKIDPTVTRALREVTPFTWTPTLFAQQPAFWEEAQAHGIRHGWGFSTRGFGSIGVLAVARSHDAIASNELSEVEARMVWLANMMHGVISKLCTPQLQQEENIGLSSREVEVLKWTAAGKTAAEIGQILGLSERTVNFHITGSLVKLDSVNKTQAVVKAVMLGLLYRN